MVPAWLALAAGLAAFAGALALAALVSKATHWPWRDGLMRWISWSERERLARQLSHAGLATWHLADLVALKAVSALALGVCGFVVWPRAGPTLIAAGLGLTLPGLWLRQQVAKHQTRLTAELPAFLDLLTVCLSSGLNLQSAIQVVLEHQPHTALAELWRRWLSNVRTHSSRQAAFQQLMADASAPALRRVCAAMMQAEQSGAGVSMALSAQAAQLRRERLTQAERKALVAPVKMLMPLVICFFPSTFLVLAFAMWINLGEAGMVGLD